MLRQYLCLPILLLALFGFVPAKAAENWSLCSAPSFQYIGPTGLADGETRVEADEITSEERDILRLVGNVSFEREHQRLSADEITLKKQSDQLSARGDVRLEQPGYRISSDRAEIDNRNETASFEFSRFEVGGRHAHGSADRIARLDRFRNRFEGLFYTACDPGDPVWRLRASELEIDDESGRGSAWHTRIYLRDIPVLYLPYFQFPVDDRRLSGMLTPSMGYSEDNGGSLVVPIYWNMAPNYDMTITPAHYHKRGTQLNTENRYLFASHRGQLDLSWLDDRALDDTRWFQRWRHTGNAGPGIGVDLLLAEVSDGEIFDDFETIAPEYNHIRHLERHLRLGRDGENWTGKLLWQDHQTLDPNTSIENRPYSRLPQLTVESANPYWENGLETPLRIEATRFERDESVTGDRGHLVTALRWVSRDSWYFLIPELQIAATSYVLDGNPGGDHLERAVPTLSIDSGLVFERPAGKDARWLQTLEPRLYLLHTPFEDQDDFPDFDTALKASTYANLFSNNRFNGADRIGDATQVTFGLASRLFDRQDGSQLMHLRLGQIYYLEDRRVSLDGNRDTSGRSDAIGEFDLWPNERTRISSRLVYAQATEEIDDGEISINYGSRGLVANLAYYYKDEELEQALASLVYPVNERWTLFAKYHQSLQFERPVDHLLGFGYESCCWGFKLMAGQSGDEDEDFAETDNRIYFELTLKGLSDAGADIDARLSESIPGYHPVF